jgi:hypothetical protein
MDHRDKAAWDHVSRLVLRTLRPFADFFAMFVSCVAGGGLLTVWVMVDAHHLVWQVAAILSLPCFFFAWLSEALRRRYLRLIQIAPYPRSREPV